MSRLPTPLRPLFPILKRVVLATTEVSQRIVRLLPRARTRLRPPRHMASSTERFAAAHPDLSIEVVPVLGPIVVERSAPLGQPPDHWAFSARLREVVPSAFVARLPSGRVVGNYGAVITADDTLLFDLSPYFGARRPTQHPVFLNLTLAPVHDVGGSLGVLTTRGVDNYYHFLLDVLPRLDLLRRCGLAVDRFLVNRSTAFQKELLDAFGLAPRQVIESSRFPHVRAEQLLVPSLPDNEMRTPGWIVPFLRNRLLPAQTRRPSGRIFFGRGNRRNNRSIKNEGALREALRDYDVEPVDPGTMSVAEQVRLFAEAELVIAAHGAALTNLVFCSAGTKIVELFPADYVNPCYWALSAQVPELDYRYLVADQKPRAKRKAAGISSDFDVNIAALRKVLEAP